MERSTAPGVAPKPGIFAADTDAKILLCYEAMRELRPHLKNPGEFLSRVKAQWEAGFRLDYVEAEGTAAACIGYRVIDFLFSGKTLYIDDFVTAERFRKRGYADSLMEHMVKIARELGCVAVSLDSGHHRYDAHRFYLNHGFKITSHHFHFELSHG